MAELLRATATSILLSTLLFPYLSLSCYKFPSDMNDPCDDKKCQFGAQCRPSLDGRTANCVCPDKCASYGDNRGSRPVCGTDGRDYATVCDMRRNACQKRKDIQVKFQGKCDPCEGVHCPGSQECQLNENRHPICRCNAACTTDIRPVCASDGKTYTNECNLLVEACKLRRTLRVIYSGQCEKGVNPCDSARCNPRQQCHIDHYGIATCQCPGACEPAMRPVCGSDGVTYDNICELSRQACLEKKNVTMVHTGVCGETSPCSTHKCEYGAICIEKESGPICECPSCSEEFRPVCGSDGISYANECKMRRESCYQKKNIQVSYQGLCTGCENKYCDYYAVCESGINSDSKCICPQTCVSVDSPVCGTDGITYPNECEMRISACRKQQHIIVAHNGPCDFCQIVRCKYGALCEDGRCICPKECPDILEPICSNDGVTYKNECEMLRASCQQNQELNVLFYGECKSVGGSDIEVQVLPCDGETPLRDPKTDEEYYCGEGSKPQTCPPNSFCHRSLTFATCCREVLTDQCDCNKLGSLEHGCDHLSKQCHCKPGVGGLKCDRCEPGFWGLHQISDGHEGCQPCQCHKKGSVRDDCEQMTGRCVCKPMAQGAKCDTCLEEKKMTDEGCTVAPNRNKENVNRSRTNQRLNSLTKLKWITSNNINERGMYSSDDR